jgi:hypothetical protein
LQRRELGAWRGASTVVGGIATGVASMKIFENEPAQGAPMAK